MWLYGEILTEYEKQELAQFQYIYTIGSQRIVSRRQVCGSNNLYRVSLGEQIGYRYQVEKVLDKGAFGQVLRCLDMKDSGKPVALKISRDIVQEAQNAKVEARILKQIKSMNGAQHGLIQMIDSFAFRGFYCIVFELMEVNLYQHMRYQTNRCIKKDKLRDITAQLVKALI